MISIIISLYLLWLSTSPTLAIEPPSITAISPITQSKMYFNNDLSTINAEVTPWSLGTKTNQGGWSTFFISTDQTSMCTTPSNLLTITATERLVDGGTCRSVSKPAINPSNYSNASELPLWKRDYNAVFSAHLLSNVVYTVNHGESNNNNFGRLPSCSPVADMGYGSLPCTDYYWWGSYNAYITLSSFPWDSEALTQGPTLTDYGPITWPSNGYIESLDGNKTWIKATDGGVRTPSSIIHNGHLYVFYEDTSQGSSTNGRGPGIKLARAPINNGVIDPNSFYSLYNGAFTDLSLPAGFKLETYYNSLAQKGGRSSSLFPNEPVVLSNPTPGTKRTDRRQIGEVISFSVAKINGTDQFLGVGYDLSKGVTLRKSSNLINWSDPIIVPGTKSNYWEGIDLQKVPLLYPRLMNKNGDIHTVIDMDDFYIIGTQTAKINGVDRKIVNQIRLKLSTGSSLPGDFNSDGTVNSTDYAIFITGYGTKYTLLDYAKLVSNYGK